MDQPHARRATWRLDARMQKRMQAAVVALLCFLMFLGLRPWFVQLGENRDAQVCQHHIMKIAAALRLYAEDWDDTYPVAASWMDAVRGNMGVTSGTGFKIETYFQCPRDRSGSASSYAYNSLMSGINPGVLTKDSETEARRRRLRRPHNAALVIERHRTPANGSLPLEDWASVQRAMTTPHRTPERSGFLINGNGGVERKTAEQLASLAGRRF